VTPFQYLILPAANARAATMLPVVNGVLSLFGDTPEERKAKKAIVIQSIVYGAMISGICIMIMFSPGLLSVKWKQIQDRAIWGTWVMLCGALSMSKVMGSSGLADWLAAFIHPLVEGYSWWMMLLLVLAGTQIIRIGMLYNIAAITVLAPILIALAPN
jgi:di/tricarboxylate transporter